MSFAVKTIYPKTESQANDQQVETKKTTFSTKVEQPDVLDQYQAYLKAGYQVAVKYDTQDDDDQLDPFTMGTNLTKQGIDYQATLKTKVQGLYSEVKPIAKLIETSGFDYRAAVTLKVDDNSPVNFDHAETWQPNEGKDAIYKLTPKAKSTNVAELKTLYDRLNEQGYETTIDLKPKLQSSDDADEDFAKQLSVYPEGTLITFTLKDAEN